MNNRTLDIHEERRMNNKCQTALTRPSVERVHMLSRSASFVL